MDKAQRIIEEIKKLEQDLLVEIQKMEANFFYKIQGRKVYFEEQTRRYHRALATTIGRYLLSASLANTLTAPLIWSCLVPALFLDAVVSVYQRICFPIYRIPRVRRGDYIVLDRQSLAYLNGLEKLNCMYCGYFNGLIAYVQEIAARSEQYWCPIKHAHRVRAIHSRYYKFLEYGDATEYHQRLAALRKAFSDLDESHKG